MSSRLPPLIAFAATFGLLAGCSDKPQAPSLTYDALFQSDRAGIRFLAPRDWTLVSRSDLPPGEFAKPILLVSYLQSSGPKPAELDLYIADLPPGADFARYFTERRFGPLTWKLKVSVQAIEIGGIRGERLSLTSGVGKDEVAREVSAVRRGGKVFFFLVSFAARDEDHRDHTRKCIESVTWTK